MVQVASPAAAVTEAVPTLPDGDIDTVVWVDHGGVSALV